MADPARSPLFSLTPDRFLWWGRLVFGTGLALGLLLTVFLAWKVPAVLPFFPVVLLGGIAAWHLFRRPELNLYICLGGFVLIIDYSEGLQVQEILYGLYFLSFLGYWYLTRVFFYRDRLLRTAEDRAILLFMGYAVLSASWGLVLGARPGNMFGEAMVLAMLGFYFPVKELCMRRPRGAQNLLLLIGWFALFVSVRNLFTFRAGLAEATQLWQIISGRVALNEVLLMMPALGTLGMLLYARRWRQRLWLIGAFLLLTAGLVLTQSRGYWVAFAAGVLALFILVDGRRKLHILALGFLGMGSFLLVGFFLFHDFLLLILTGLLNRLTSLGSAFTSDLSLINRFYESAAVWKQIKLNPILGYGIGAEYRVFDLILDTTPTKTFIHNGYLGMWFKYGLVGLGLLLFFWGRIIGLAIRLFRMETAPLFLRLIGLMAATSLIGEALVANTSTPFQISDATLMIALLGGLVSGILARLQALPPPAHR